MNRPIRVLLTTPHLSMDASPWREVESLVKYHAPERVQYTVCAMYNRMPDTVEFLERHGAKSFQGLYRAKNPRASQLREFWATSRRIHQEGFDLQHSFDFSSSPTEAMAARASGRLFIHHQRNLNENGNSMAYRLKLRFCDHVIAIAQHAEDFARRNGARDVTLVRNGIDLAQLPAPPDRAARTPGQLLCVAHLQPRKRIHDAIRAFASFRSRHCPGATLDIAGSSYQAGYGEELAQLAASLGVTDAVRMLGPVKDVLERMRSASALLQLAESEVQPWVVVEAMASGLPIVASRIAAHEELVRDGESALIVPVGDPEAACEALRRLHAEPALADQLTANGERRVRQEFDARQMAERVSQVYETLMGQRRPKALASAVGAGHS